MTPPFTIDQRVRWSQVDQAGIIFYGAYVHFFEVAEAELFRAAGVPYGEVFDRFDVWLPRVHMEVDFEYPARLDDELRVAAYFTRFGTSSLRIQFDVLHLGAGRLAAHAHEILVCTSRESLRPRPLPEELREIFTRYLSSAEDARAHLGVR